MVNHDSIIQPSVVSTTQRILLLTTRSVMLLLLLMMMMMTKLRLSQSSISNILEPGHPDALFSFKKLTAFFVIALKTQGRQRR